MQPPSYGRVAVIGMDEFAPPSTGQALRRVAEIFDGPLIQVVQFTFRSTAPDQRRDRLNQETELTLACGERVLGNLGIGYILNRSDKKRSALDTVDQVGDRVQMLHLAAPGEESKGQIEIRAAKRPRELRVE